MLSMIHFLKFTTWLAPTAHENFSKLNNAKLTPPPNFDPYRRLLAWRSRKCGTEFGFNDGFKNFDLMNQLSEESNSVGSAEDITECNPSASTDLEVDEEGKKASNKRIRLENWR